MKRMLINATHAEEIRVALADGQKLYNLDIDIPGQDRKKGNIYKGRITRVEPSLEAAFVDYGSERHGFLPYKEISKNYFTDEAKNSKERVPINEAVKEGTEVIIQVNKEERGNKGAAISTFISLAGRYLVYMPENPRAGGISRRIEGRSRQELKKTLSQINQPKNSGVIVRTAGIGRTAEELDWDLNYLDQVWTAIKTVAASRNAPFFIYQESDIFIRALRDYLRPDVGEILIDNKEIYNKARDFMQQVMPHNLKKLSYYNDTTPLFSRYQIEGQIQSAFAREVRLPSGGALVIDHTEALISIDINSARATKGADIEETATMTNLEAADEIARQLRIRDLGGLVVIDFIDMRNHKNQRLVEQKLNEAVENDRARVQVGKISRFGLLEMSRQRLRSSINEASQFVCPRCSGHGFIRNIESLSVSILRLMEEEAQKPETGKVIAQVPSKVANFIINEKRTELFGLEKRHEVPMLIVANEFYQSPQFDVTRLKKSEADKVNIDNIRLNKPENEEEAENKSIQSLHQHTRKAAIDVLTPESQAPSRNKGVVGWLKSLFSSDKNNKKTQKKKVSQNSKNTNRTNQYKNNQAKKASSNRKQQPQKRKPQPQTNKNQNQNQNQNQGKKGNAANRKPLQKKTSKKQNVRTSNSPKQNQAKQQQKQNNKQTNVAKKSKVTPKKNEAVESIDKAVTEKTSEQILKRPLGSVASYAANKKAANEKPVTNQNQQPPKPDSNKSGAKSNQVQPQGNKNKSDADVKSKQPAVKKEVNDSTKKAKDSPAQSLQNDKNSPQQKPGENKKTSVEAAVAKQNTKTDDAKINNLKTQEKAETKASAEKKKQAETQSSQSETKTGTQDSAIPEKKKATKKTTKKTAKKTTKKTSKKSQSKKVGAEKQQKTEVSDTKPDTSQERKSDSKANNSNETAKTEPVKAASAKKSAPKKSMPDPSNGIDFDI